jgi:hypothetical protein
MENAENMGIPVWMSIWACLRGKHHNVTVSVRVHRILIAADVICCVVDTKHLCGVYLLPNIPGQEDGSKDDL